MQSSQLIGLASAMAAQHMCIDDLPKFLKQIPEQIFDENKETLIDGMTTSFGSFYVS